MKMKYKIAVLLTALFLAPLSGARAQETQPFGIHPRAVLQGMKRSYLQGYEPTISGNTLSLVLPIESSRASGAIQAELIMPDEALSPFKPQTMTVKAQRAESGLWPVRFSLEMHPDRKMGDYPCAVAVWGQDAQGALLRAVFPFTLHIRDGLPNPEEKRILVSEVTSDFRVGEDGSVTMTVTNPCKTVIYEGLKLQLSDPAGEILPQSADTLRLPDLGPGESQTVSFPVTVLKKAAAAPHCLSFAWQWTALSQPMTQAESYTLPVAQEIRLSHGGLRMAGSVVAGDTASVSWPIMNLGKAEIVNTMVTLSLPGLTEGQSVLVGTIGPGETRQAQLTVAVPRSGAGEYSGEITARCFDDSGNEAFITLPVYLKAEKPPADAEASGEAAEKTAEISWIEYLLGGGCGALFLAFILQGALLRRKIRRLEEEKL